MWFTSDNAGPAHPDVLTALAKANEGYTNSYGTDPIMDEVRTRVRDIFEAPEAEVFLVATGTAANVLSLATICPPWGTIYCHRNAHIEEDECGAPEFFTGGSKLTLLEGADAKIDPASLEKALKFTARAGVHNVQKGALSLTNATEAGAVYTLDEIKALTALAKEHEIPVHMDGARFTNALVHMGCSAADMTWRAGVDILSFGGTKNGLIGVEAVVLFDPTKAWEFELRRKRGAHLFSKHRFLSAQMLAYLTDDLWIRCATHANQMASELSRGLMQSESTKLLHPVEANAVFAAWPRAGHRRVQDAGGHYYFWPFDQSLDGPDDDLLSARLVCNWSTTQPDIASFVEAVKS